ncbi:SCO7613 C-terminal domain-containing membrane protein [Microbacterium hibisci]|uniref:SCO7613 C-terminal domain-containing membrane protein n=1 Tax=Microbacterium hibisci TaxID=2036000 RepID=UPI0019453CBF|nr:hypothetical protein [Microbacterium hibisci]
MSTVAAAGWSAPAWNDAAIAELLDVARCPVCTRGIVAERRCPVCGADFTGAIGHDLWVASQRAVDALRARQTLLEQVPVSTYGVARSAAADAAATASDAATTTGATAAPASDAESAALPSGASATVQSVLAVAGAGLVAIAAVVFTFFNPDLADPLPRAAIIGAIAAAFLGGSALLSRRRLRFSAEAIGALGVVFLALTVTAALPLLPPAFHAWAFAGLAALVAGGTLGVLGPRVGIRAWVWSGTLALAFAPLMLSLAAGSPLAATTGCLASAAAASALVALAGRGDAGFARPLTTERVTLTVAQFGLTAAALLVVWGTDAAAGVPVAVLASAVFVCVAALAVASARHPAGAVWTGAAGAAIVAAFAVLPLAVPSSAMAGWLGAFPVATALGLVVLGALSPLHRAVPAGPLFGGAVVVVAAVAVVPTMTALLTLAGTLARPSADVVILPETAALSLTAGLAALALGLAAFAALTAPRDAVTDDGAGAAASDLPAAKEPDGPEQPDGIRMPRPLGTRRLGFVGAWFAVLAFLTVLTLAQIEVSARIAIALGAAVVVSAVVAAGLRDAGAAVRMPLVAGAHAAVVFAAVLSWHDDALTVWAGAAVVATTAVLATTVPRAARFVHVGVAFAYALVVFATALARSGADAIVVVCLTTCVAGAVAIAVTFIRRVPSREWYAVLAVTAVPFAIGVLQVVIQRSGWTALSTTVVFLLALTLVTTTRRGLSVVVRTLAAATLVPAAAVVAVCLGAELLPMSGSPVVLPVIAALVAGVLASADALREALRRRVPRRHARLAVVAVEASALLTAVIAVLLSLVRASAGLPTTLLVLLILGIGFVAEALLSPRRSAWPLAGAAFTGALWSAWGIAGVTGLEPYLLPPALVAALVAAVLTARGRPAPGLYAAGLGVAVVPVLVALALAGTYAEPPVLTLGGGSPARAYGLVGAAWLLVAASVVVTKTARPRIRRLRALRVPTLAAAVLAATAAAVQGVRWGVGLDAAPSDPAVVAALAFGLLGTGAAASAAALLRRQTPADSPLAETRWLGAPAVLILGVATWPAIERDWFVIWTMWALLLALLAFMVVVAARSLRGPTGLPPVWFVFAVSFVTAVVAWSPRDLRVEWFSLPLGAFLLAAGALALRRPAGGPSGRPATGAPRRTLDSWPAGWTGSWALLAPGLVTMLSASVAATYTDPRTWRAILVMAIALAAILVGATQRLAAPFLIGIVVLPVENVLAFMVQIGRGIEAMPWWITLSVVGVVLLIIAVGYERRAGDETGLAARLRDLA